MNLIEEKYTSLNVRVSKNGVCNLAFCFTNQKIYETWNRIHRTRKSPYYSFYMTITTPFRFLLLHFRDLLANMMFLTASLQMKFGIEVPVQGTADKPSDCK